MFGLWIGRDRRKRGAVVAGDSGGTLRVQQVLPVTKPQHEPVTLHEGDAQHAAIGDFLITVTVRTQLEHRLKQWLPEAELTSQTFDRKIFMRQEFRFGSSSVQQNFPPRGPPKLHPKRQRRSELQPVAGAHLALAREC